MTRAEDMQVRHLRSSLRGPYTLDIPAGACTVLSGPSGIGKSLLLRMIADLDPNDGIVSIGEVERSSVPAPRWRSLVTYVAAEPGWWAETVAAHMTDRVAALALMAELNLNAAVFDAPIAQLSTGERQRAALVRAIIRQPRFLLLDEPTSALDEDTKRIVETVLKRVAANGAGLLVISHDPAQVARLADRHLVMSATGLAEAAT